MANLIDRNRLLLEIESDENKAADAMQFERYSEMVKRQPAIDAVPMAHGHWIQLFGEWIEESLVGRVNRCSVCRRNIITDGIDKTGKALVATVNNPFCRWCGAKMDEDGE